MLLSAFSIYRLVTDKTDKSIIFVILCLLSVFLNIGLLMRAIRCLMYICYYGMLLIQCPWWNKSFFSLFLYWIYYRFDRYRSVVSITTIHHATSHCCPPPSLSIRLLFNCGRNQISHVRLSVYLCLRHNCKNGA